MLEHFAHDNVRPLNEAHFCRGVRPDLAGQDIPDPWPRGIDEHAGGYCLAGTGPCILDDQRPEAVCPVGADKAMACFDDRAAFPRIHRVEYDEARILDPAIGIFESDTASLFERNARGITLQAERARGRQEFAAAEMIIDEQAEAQEPCRPQSLVMGQHEPQRPDDVRCKPPEDFTLDQCFADEPEFVMFEIAEPAMDQLGRPGRGTACQIILLAEIDGQATARRVPRNAAAVNAATDNGNIDTQLVQRALPFPLLKSVI